MIDPGAAESAATVSLRERVKLRLRHWRSTAVTILQAGKTELPGPPFLRGRRRSRPKAVTVGYPSHIRQQQCLPFASASGTLPGPNPTFPYGPPSDQTGPVWHVVCPERLFDPVSISLLAKRSSTGLRNT